MHPPVPAPTTITSNFFKHEPSQVYDFDVVYLIYLVVKQTLIKYEVSSVTLGVNWMSSKPALSKELRRLIETRMETTLKGIEDTLQRILENQEIRLEDLKESIQSLEKSFNLLSQKWSLEILYTLFFRNTMGFNGLRKILGVNSRTLSNKLRSLEQYEYIRRTIDQGPPLRVKYFLTTKGRNIVLLALPLLYYSSS
jgi:DNA-binding HxlR family transcriptional regulator